QCGDEFFWIQTAMMNALFLVTFGHLAEAHSLELRAREKAERCEDAYSGSAVAWTGGNISLWLLDPCAALSKFSSELSRPRTSRSGIRSAPLLELSGMAYDWIGEKAESRRVRAQLRGVDSPVDMPREHKGWDSAYANVFARVALARSNGEREALCHFARMLGEMCRSHGMYREGEAFLKESLDIASNAPHLPHALLTELFLCV